MRKIRNIIKVTALGASLLVAGFGPATAETLTQTLADTYRHSGLIDRNRATLRAADEGVAQAMAALRPTLNYALNNTYTGGPGAAVEGLTTVLTLSSEITLYDFGRNKLAVEAQKETVLATRQVLLAVESQVLLSAVNAFFDVREGFETVSLRQNNVRLITQELRAARDRFEVGEVTRTDVAIAESRLAGARANLAAAEGQLAIAVATFRDAVGRAPGGLRQPRSLPSLPSSVEAAKAIARRTSPDILGLQNQITAAELTLRRAELAIRPTVGATASSSFNLSDGVSGARSDRVTLGVSGPIYAGGALNSAIRQARATLDGLRSDLHVARHSVDRNVESAYAQLAVARASSAASDEQIRAATVAFRGVREEATLGARTTLDVLELENELLTARSAKVTAEADTFRAAYGVLAAMGTLTAKDLSLPVQLYDPAGYYELVKGAPASSPLSKQGAKLDQLLESLGKN